MRSSKEERLVDSDSSIAIDRETTENILSKYDEVEDCYTKEWEPKTPECSSCASEQVCGILFSARQKKSVKKFEEGEKVTPLDLADFSAVPADGLVNIAKQFEESGEYMGVEELLDFVKDKSSCNDDVAAIEWIKRWIRDNEGIYTKDGYLRYKS